MSRRKGGACAVMEGDKKRRGKGKQREAGSGWTGR